MTHWNTLTWIFLALVAVSFLVEYALSARHIRHIRAHRRSVPTPFRRKIALKLHQRSADYTTAKVRFGQVASLYGTALLLFWTLAGGFDTLDRWLSQFAWHPVVTGAAFVLGAFVLMELLELPVTLYQTFVIEGRFGFNRTTPALFVMDLAKKLLLMLIIGAPLVVAALWLMDSLAGRWWLYLWCLWMGFTLFLVWAYPTLIAPIFNKFQPLRSRPLRSRLLRLLRRTGFRSNGIFVIDSSQRTTHGNAYFTGFGQAKRIVFFDSLLKTLRAPEIEAVVAHELGHFKHRHVAQRLVLMSFTSFLGLAILGWLAQSPWFYQGLGMSQPSNHAALMLFLLAGPVFTFFFQPLYAWGSRRHEYQADTFAAEQTNARNLISALVKLYRDNAATLTPDPWYSAFYDSHPPALQRIQHLLAR